MAVHRPHQSVIGISAPKIGGAKNNVFIAHGHHDDDYIFKVTDFPMAAKNQIVARRMQTVGIRVPDITIMRAGGQVFETYPMIPGKTLYECIGDGKMSDADIRDIYMRMLKLVYCMSFIQTCGLSDMQLMRADKITRANIGNVNGDVMGTMAAAVVRMANRGPREIHGLYHFEMTPKNVIVGAAPDNRLALIDMDSVGVCDKNFAIAMMVAKYAQMGYPIADLLDYYEHISHNPLNRGRIGRIVDITNAGKTMLWHHAQKNKSR